MRIFDIDQISQGSPDWWDMKRGIPSASNAKRIITASKGEKSSAWEAFVADLIAEVAAEDREDARWFTERLTRPPNTAIAEGVRREAESRHWLEYERDCSVQQVGFCLSDCGMFGCSPDGLLISDSGILYSSLELKNPQLNTHAGYLIRGTLPNEYKPQCHAHLVVTGLDQCLFLSYCPGLEAFPLVVQRDEYTARLEELLHEFVSYYLGVLDRLKLRGRFEEQRRSILSHFPKKEQ